MCTYFSVELDALGRCARVKRSESALAHGVQNQALFSIMKSDTKRNGQRKEMCVRESTPPKAMCGVRDLSQYHLLRTWFSY